MGLVVLLGWTVDSALLKQVVPGLAAMTANTAICFVLAGAALLLCGRRRLRIALAASEGLIALATASQYLLGRDLEIDQLLFRDPGDGHALFPGRMSLMTSVGFVFSFLALLFLGSGKRLGKAFSDGFAVVVGMVALVALVGYVFNVADLYAVSVFSSMALHTSTAFLILAAGILVSNRDGLGDWMFGHSPGGFMLRVLIPMTIIIPLLIGGLRVRAQMEALLPPAFAAALEACLLILLFGALICATAGSLNVLETRRKRAENALHRSEQRYRSLYETSLDSIFSLGPDGRFLASNAAAQELSGYPAPVLEGLHFRDICAADRRAVVEEAFRAAFRRQRLVFETAIVTKRGDRREILVSVTPMIVDDKVEAVSCIARDMTDRLKTENELRFRSAAIEAAPSGIALVGRDGEIVWVNPAFCKMTGYEKSEVLEKNLRLLKSGQHPSEFYATMWRTVVSGQIWHGEVINRRKDGRLYSEEMTIAPLKDKEGVVTHFVAVKQDITRRKQAETNLLHSERRFSGIVESAMDAIISIDADQKVQLFNEAAEQMFGCPAMDAIGTSIARFIPERFRAAHADHVRAFGNSGVTNRAMGHLGELSGLRADGSEFPIEASISKVEVGGEPVFTVILRDITERREVERAMLEAKEAAEAASDLKSQFLANVSHEVRTPLTGIIGLNNMLLEGELNAEQRQLASMVQESADTLLAVVNSLLEFSKIEAGQVMLDTVAFQIRAVVESVAALFSGRASAKGIRIDCVVAPEVPEWLKGDPMRLRQVLLNLVSNAVKFSNEGVVRIAAAVESWGESRIVLGFRVRDEGIGIPGEACERIFESFQQADGSTTRRFGGTGLGLAISKELVELMGGRIGVEESEPGRGSTFYFTCRLLPIGDDFASTRAGSSEAALPPGTGGSPLRVLIVEGSATERVVAIGYLERLGHFVHHVVNGREAIEETSGGKYDLVLMDCQIPVIDGIAAAKEIRRRESPDHVVRIVAVAGNATDSEREECFAAGMDGYIRKPYGLERLKAEIEALFPGRGESQLHSRSDQQSIDPEFAAELMKDSQEADLLPLLARRFSRDAQALLQAIEDAVASEELHEVEALATKLVGASADFRAWPLMRVCQLALENARMERPEELQRVLPLIRRELRRLEESLRALRGETPEAS